MLIAFCDGFCVLLSPSIFLMLKVSDFQTFILLSQCSFRGGASRKRKAQHPASYMGRVGIRVQPWTGATRCWEDAGPVPGGGTFNPCSGRPALCAGAGAGSDPRVSPQSGRGLINSLTSGKIINEVAYRRLRRSAPLQLRITWRPRCG